MDKKKKPFYNHWLYWVFVLLFAGFIASRFPDDVSTVLFLFISILIMGVLFSFGMNHSRKIKEKLKEYQANEHHYAVHLHGVPHVSKGMPADLFLTDQKIIIECEKKKFELDLDRITAAEALRKTDLLQKDKSVIARGVIGGVLIGPLGAIIGGMSGIGKKNKKGDYLVLNYKSVDDGEVKVIIFDMKNFSKAQKIAKSLTNRIIENKAKDGVIEL